MNKLFFKKEQLPLWWYFHNLFLYVIMLGLMFNFYISIKLMPNSLFKFEATCAFGLAFITILYLLIENIKFTYNYYILKTGVEINVYGKI